MFLAKLTGFQEHESSQGEVCLCDCMSYKSTYENVHPPLLNKKWKATFFEEIVAPLPPHK